MERTLLRVLTVISFLLFAAAMLQIVWSWSHLPDRVPTHYNALGEADRWGHKAFIFFPPLFGLVMWLLLNAIRNPKFMNMPGFQAENATAKQIANVRLMLNVLANELLILMCLLSFKDVYVARGGTFSLGVFEMLIVLVILIGTVLFFTFRNSHLKDEQ